MTCLISDTMAVWEGGETKFNGLKHTRTHRKPKFNTINIIHKCGVIIISTDALKRTGFPPHCALSGSTKENI